MVQPEPKNPYIQGNPLHNGVESENSGQNGSEESKNSGENGVESENSEKNGSEESKNSENIIPPEWSGQKIRLNKLPKGWFGTRSKKNNTNQPNTAKPNPSQSKSVTKKRGWFSSLFGLSDTSVDTPIVTPPSEFALGELPKPKEKSEQFLRNFEAAIVEIERLFNKNENGEQKSPPSKINPIDVKKSMTAALQIYLKNKHNIVEKDQVVFKILRNRYNKLVGIFLSKAKEKGIGLPDPPIPILITDDLIIDKIDNRIREIELAIKNFEHTNVSEIEKKIGELSDILAHTTLKDHFGDIIGKLKRDLQTMEVSTPTVNDNVCNDDEEISKLPLKIHQDIKNLTTTHDIPAAVQKIKDDLLAFRGKLETKNCLKTYQNRYATLERELSNYTGLMNPIPLIQNIGGKRTVRKNKTRRLMTNRQHMRHCK